MLCVKQFFVSGPELNVPSMGVEFHLAQVLPLLQQRTHFRSHGRHQVRGGLTRPDGDLLVGCVGRGERTALVLTAVGVKGPEPSGDAESLMVNASSHNGR